MMCHICENIINEVWRNISVGQRFRTPDLFKGVDFSIQLKNKDSISIVPQKISISRTAFLKAIHYLRVENHDIDNPCEIRSSNDRKNSGPLCVAARDEKNNVRCINYILPILQKNVIVGINPVRPNTTWLLQWK
jgi:hypothetical protein